MKINGKHKYLWLPVDQEGQVPDILVQAKRNTVAAEPDNASGRMKRFKSAAQAKHFLSIFGEAGNLFALARNTVSAVNHRLLLNKSLNT